MHKPFFDAALPLGGGRDLLVATVRLLAERAIAVRAVAVGGGNVALGGRHVARGPIEAAFRRTNARLAD